MKLKQQMLLAGVLTLLVPLVGWQSVRELDASLRMARADAQRLSLARLQLGFAGLDSAALQADMERGREPVTPGEIYAQRAPAPLIVDGYDDDWRELAAPSWTLSDAQGSLRVRAADRGGRLFLSIDVDDERRIYHRPPRLRADAGENEQPGTAERIANGDAVHVLSGDGGRWTHGVFSPVAPGPVVAVASADTVFTESGSGSSYARPGRRLSAWRGAFSERPGGYRVEVSLPMPDEPARLAIAVVDVDRHGQPGHWRGALSALALRTTLRAASVAPEHPVPRLYHASAAARTELADRVPLGARVRLFDAQGRLLADVDRLNQGETDLEGAPRPVFRSFADALLFRVFAFLVAGDLPLTENRYASATANDERATSIDPYAADMRTLRGTHRYVTDALDRVLGTLEPIGVPVGEAGIGVENVDALDGWLWYESNEEHSAAFTGSRLARLFSLLVLASALASVLLFGWATWLSWRVRSLSHAASAAVSPDGQIARFVPSRARDEIGALSRDIGALLRRSGDYHHYLEALSSRLSHELRTPLAVVRSSMEHLGERSADEQMDVLIERATSGASELDRLIRSLIESTRLEQTLERATLEPLSVDDFLDGCTSRYESAFPGFTITLDRGPASIPAQAIQVRAAPELLVQAFDKLVTNAVDFSLERRITLVRTIDAHGQVFLGVANAGALDALATPPEHWFLPPSESSRANDGQHLGLGLLMVRLIAERHGGRPRASHRQGRTEVGMVLPRIGR